MLTLLLHLAAVPALAAQEAWHVIVDLDVAQAHQRMVSGATPDPRRGPFVQADGTVGPCPPAWVFLNITVRFSRPMCIRRLLSNVSFCSCSRSSFARRTVPRRLALLTNNATGTIPPHCLSSVSRKRRMSSLERAGSCAQDVKPIRRLRTRLARSITRDQRFLAEATSTVRSVGMYTPSLQAPQTRSGVKPADLLRAMHQRWTSRTQMASPSHTDGVHSWPLPILLNVHEDL